MLPARKLTAQDAQAMADIHAQSFPRPWPALDMAVHIKTDICLGVGSGSGIDEDEGEPLGAFIIIRASEHEAEILTIAARASERRKGYGRALVQAAAQQLAQANARNLFLEVAEDNLPARALYKLCGFAPIGRRPAYYRRENGRVAAITYSKALDAAT